MADPMAGADPQEAEDEEEAAVGTKAPPGVAPGPGGQTVTDDDFPEQWLWIRSRVSPSSIG